jgi:hypothetical protein
MSNALTNDCLTVRCPYCTGGGEFRLMVDYRAKQFVCLDCSHQERPAETNYRCSCPHCLKLAMGLSSIAFMEYELAGDYAHR